MLEERGVSCIQQQAIGPYNCDLGAFPVAVEIFGGNWHFSGAHLARSEERTRYLLNAGWHVLMVQATANHPIDAATADYIAVYVKEARRDLSVLREYRVIRGAGETIAGGSANDEHISIVPTLKNGKYVVSQDKRFA
jgi:hypothetical protein